MYLRKILQKKKNNAEIIKKHYKEILDREPDDLGFNHYLGLMERNEMDEKGLVEILENSDEYKRIQTKKQFIEKYDMSKDFYGKVWVGQDDKWYSDMFDQVPLLHSDFIEYLRMKKDDIKTVLEVGCGSGIYPIRFKEFFLNKKYTGVDISESAIFHCKKNSEFEFICGDFLKMNLDRKYDLVFSHGVVDHVYDIDLFLSKIVLLCRKYAFISAYYGYHPTLKDHEIKYIKNEGYYLNKLSVTKIRETLLKNGLDDSEFLIRPQPGGHIDLKEETVIEIKRKN